jgi:hypothetical protein
MKKLPQSIVACIFAAMQDKTAAKKKTTATKKCRKSEPWLLGTSWLSAQQLHILLRSAPPNLLAMSCGTSDFV